MPPHLHNRERSGDRNCAELAVPTRRKAGWIILCSLVVGLCVGGLGRDGSPREDERARVQRVAGAPLLRTTESTLADEDASTEDEPTPIPWGESASHALFSERRVDIGADCLFDSYDSEVGSYFGQAKNTLNGMSHALVGATLVSNEAIRVAEDSSIAGSLLAAPGGRVVWRDEERPPYVHGSIAALDAPLAMAPVIFPFAGAPATQDLHVHADPFDPGHDLVLGPGEWHYGEVEIHQGGDALFVGPLTLVVDGKFELDAKLHVDGTAGPVTVLVGGQVLCGPRTQVLTPADSATDFVVKLGYADLADAEAQVIQRVILQGSFTGIVYAPRAHVEIRNYSRIYGSVMAYSMRVGSQTRFHYDEALTGMNIGLVRKPVLSNPTMRSVPSEDSRLLRGRFTGFGRRDSSPIQLSAWTLDAQHEWDRDPFPWLNENFLLLEVEDPEADFEDYLLDNSL